VVIGLLTVVEVDALLLLNFLAEEVVEEEEVVVVPSLEVAVEDSSLVGNQKGADALGDINSKTTLRITMIPLKMMVVFLLMTIILLSSPSHAAYRIGDAVGILIRTSTSSSSSAASTTTTSVIIEAYRHQLPRFGLSTRTSFDIRTLIHGPEYLQDASNHKQRNNIVEEQQQQQQQQPQNLRLSISFDDGFHHIPWVDVYNNNNNNNNKNHRVLESLVITIIYSSGDGRIHAVHRNVKYTTTATATTTTTVHVPKKFNVEYIWINESDINIQDGILTMYICVLLVSLLGVMEAFRAATGTASTSSTSSKSSSLYMDNDDREDGKCC
jgi:hypothetical protein